MTKFELRIFRSNTTNSLNRVSFRRKAKSVTLFTRIGYLEFKKSLRSWWKTRAALRYIAGSCFWREESRRSPISSGQRGTVSAAGEGKMAVPDPVLSIGEETKVEIFIRKMMRRLHTLESSVRHKVRIPTPTPLAPSPYYCAALLIGARIRPGRGARRVNDFELEVASCQATQRVVGGAAQESRSRWRWLMRLYSSEATRDVP